MRSISREIVSVMKTYYGRGPESVKSYFMDDLLFVVMRGGLTTAERTMVDADREEAVREFRQQFENEMADRLRGTIEQLTGRRVVNYQSQVLFDPDLLVEIFVFDRHVDRAVLRETAEAVMGGKHAVSGTGEAEGANGREG